MKRIRLVGLGIALFASLTMVLGIGPGHTLLAQQSMSHGIQAGESSVQCQSICPPLLNERHMGIAVQEEDADPDPLPFWAAEIDQLALLSYLVLFGALAYLFLQRRPPDLVVLYANIRN